MSRLQQLPRRLLSQDIPLRGRALADFHEKCGIRLTVSKLIESSTQTKSKSEEVKKKIKKILEILIDAGR